MLQVAQAHCPTLIPEATTLLTKFKEAFKLFALCHNIYDSDYVIGDEITQLGRFSGIKDGAELTILFSPTYNR